MQHLMDIACLQGSQQQTHHTLLQQSNGTDGWTQTLLHTMQAVSTNWA